MTPLAIRYRGALAALSPDERRRLVERSKPTDKHVAQTAAAVIEAVRAEGDAAVRRFSREFDGTTLTDLEVPRAALAQALGALPAPLVAALHHAAANIERFHRATAPQPIEVEPEPGVRLRRVPKPVDRVGVYVPGGRAAYPSSVLMGVIPARVVGCGSVAVVSPPGPDGLPASAVLAAAAIAGSDRVFAVGGAQAIAALAYGTESIPRVDRIVGPGNSYVTAAKAAVMHQVGIDGLAGPSELLVLADDSSPLDMVAAEMVAQAEHDPDAAVVAVLIGGSMVEQLEAALSAAVATAPRQQIVRQSLADQGAVLWAQSAEEAIQLANDYAVEHLLIVTRNPDVVAAKISHAGAVFIGPHSSVTFGDYLSGGNHVLPTAGLARVQSGLGSDTFVRWVTEQRISEAGAGQLARDTGLLATLEGFPGHRAAATIGRER